MPRITERESSQTESGPMKTPVDARISVSSKGRRGLVSFQLCAELADNRSRRLICIPTSPLTRMLEPCIR